MFYLENKDWIITDSCESMIHIKWMNTINSEFANEEQKQKIDDFNNISWKDKIISQYKEKQKEIDWVKLEIQEIDDTKDWMSESWKALSTARLQILNNRLAESRSEKESIALEWIEKFWEEIIWEF